MKAVTLKVYVDRGKVSLDEKFKLNSSAGFVVTGLPASPLKVERQTSPAASRAFLVRADGNGESDYSAALLREEPPRE